MACALALLLGCRQAKTTNKEAGRDAAVKSLECTQADETRKTACTQLAEGRLGAALDALVAVDAKCAQSERESWPERVSVLALLGRDAVDKRTRGTRSSESRARKPRWSSRARRSRRSWWRAARR